MDLPVPSRGPKNEAGASRTRNLTTLPWREGEPPRVSPEIRYLRSCRRFTGLRSRYRDRPDINRDLGVALFPLPFATRVRTGQQARTPPSLLPRLVVHSVPCRSIPFLGCPTLGIFGSRSCTEENTGVIECFSRILQVPGRLLIHIWRMEPVVTLRYWRRTGPGDIRLRHCCH